MKLNHTFTWAAVLSLAASAWSFDAAATVTPFISAGTGCSAGTTATFTPGTPVKVSLCVSTTTEAVCGSSYKFTSNAANRFAVTARSMAPNYTYSNAQPVNLPVAIATTPHVVDLGATTTSGTAVPAGANQLLATLDITPDATATDAAYVLTVDPSFSIVAIDDGKGDCGNASAVPFTGSVTLNKAVTSGGTTTPAAAVAIASARSAVFTIKSAGSFVVSATGNPAPTLTLTGALPAGVTFANGVLAGTPALGTAGAYPLTFTAANGSNSVTQAFTLTVDKAAQTIDFAAPSGSGSSVPLAATASSGLAVAFASATPSVCAVSGRSATRLAAGACTINATQPGDGNYAAAPAVSKTFTTTPGNETPEALSVVATPAQPVAGRRVKISAMLAATNASGTVSFSDAGVPIANCSAVPLAPISAAAAVATCDVPAITAGSHAIEVSHPTTNGSIGKTSLTVTATPSGPQDYTDMWWAGQAENGWGVSITQHAEKQFIVIYAYDDNGRATWYVLPQGTWNGANTAFTGALYQPTSAPMTTYDASKVNVGAAVGSATITYSGTGTANLAYTINGVAGSKAIQRQIYAADTAEPKLAVGDMWWGGESQNGWGINISQQGKMLFPVWYAYDAAGKATYYVMPAGTWQGTTFSGEVYATEGSRWLGTTYNPAALKVNRVGSASIDFADQSNATLNYTLNNVSGSKPLLRQPY